jgi:hypothetical protein
MLVFLQVMGKLSKTIALTFLKSVLGRIAWLMLQRSSAYVPLLWMTLGL